MPVFFPCPQTLMFWNWSVLPGDPQIPRLKQQILIYPRFFLVLGDYYYIFFPTEVSWHAVFSTILPFSVSRCHLLPWCLLLPFSHTRLLSSSDRTNYTLRFSRICFLSHPSHLRLSKHTNWKLHKDKDHINLVYRCIPNCIPTMPHLT